MARFDDRRRASFPDNGGAETQSRWNGRTEDERISLASIGGSGLSHREQKVSEAASTRFRRKLLHAGTGKEIIAYARDRGIRVVPEFDIPGHSTSWLADIRSSAVRLVHTRLNAVPASSSPRSIPRAKKFTSFETFLGEMGRPLPDEYFHIGGDENEGKQWDRNPAIQDYMKRKGSKTTHALQGVLQHTSAEDSSEAQQEDGRLG